MKQAIAEYVLTTEHKLSHGGFKPSLHPLVAEKIGAELCHKLGIGAPSEIKAADRQETLAAIRSGEWIPKVILDDRLRAVSAFQRIGIADWNVLVKRIPRAISLVELRLRCGIEGRAIHVSSDDVSRDKLLNELGDIIHQGNARSYFTVSDFELPADTTKIQEAIQWGSQAMLAIHAARLFLACSAAHAGNVLVDADGKLYSVDHECVAQTSGEELELLFDNVERGTRAWNALAGVASLSHDDVVDLFSGVPDDAHWPLGSKEKTVNYFTGRLDYWKWKHAGN